MQFEDQITRIPLAHDAEQAEDIAGLFSGLPNRSRDLLAACSGCSSYLKGLILREEDWWRTALTVNADAGFEALLGEVPEGDLGTALRQLKRRAALWIALADLGGVWSLEETTRALTRLADTAVARAIAALLGAEIARGKLPGITDPDDPAGYVVLAMGKMGAGELNYSSDIDLICLFDESRFEPDDWGEARAAFVRVTRRMAALLSDLTGDGYVFRTDLRLRPDPGVTPVCMAMAAAERYYESVGRTWERAAHIKARVAAGDMEAGQAYLKRLSPFVWRKHLDYVAIQDAHDMSRRIRSHKGLGGAITLPGHNVKLGRGGIREIEFFAQTGQLIFGGRDEDLRQIETVETLKTLARKGRVEAATAETLISDYRYLREVEHRLQMVQDAQTHLLPSDDEGFDRIARFMGAADTEAWKEDLFQRLTRVHGLTEAFLAPQKSESTGAVAENQRAFVERWRSYPALRSARAVESFERLKGDLLARLSASARPDESIAVFDGFLSGLPAGAQLFALFEANPQLVDLIVDIAATAPALAQHLSRNSGVFDAVIAGEFFSDWPGTAGLTDSLTRQMRATEDYEGKLDTARRWWKEWHFRVGVHHLRGLISAAEAGAQYADLAEAVLSGVFPAVTDMFAAKHGAPPGRGAVVLGMGSLGAGRLNATSDLDLIVIYDPEDVEMSDGRRPLSTRPYYARLTQALVTALTAPMAEGRLYEVDMRLRPSGRQGPVATSLASFTSYQTSEAWTWEHLALTRARPVAGSQDLGDDVERFRLSLLGEKSSNPAILSDVRDMRARLQSEKSGDGPWEAKQGPGRLLDIELLAETCALLSGDASRDVSSQLEAGAAHGVLTPDDCTSLQQTYHLLAGLQTVARLLSQKNFDPDDVGAGGVAIVLRELSENDIQALLGRLDAQSRNADEVISRVLSGAPPSA